MTVLLDRWHGGEPARPLPQWLSDGQIAPLVERSGPEAARFVAKARQKVQSFPYGALHRSWMAALLPADPLLRQWSLECLPERERQDVLRLLDPPRGAASWIVSTPPPRWYAAFWEGRLWRATDYPMPVPGCVDARIPLSYLSWFDTSDLVLLLRHVGLRATAGAIFRLPPRDAAREVFAFPEEMREPLVHKVRDRDFPPEEGWRERLVALREAGERPAEIPLRLALDMVVAQGQARERVGELIRTAYRLPRRLGRLVLRALDEDLAHLATEEAAVFDQAMRTELRTLLAQQVVEAPQLDRETF